MKPSQHSILLRKGLQSGLIAGAILMGASAPGLAQDLTRLGHEPSSTTTYKIDPLETGENQIDVATLDNNTFATASVFNGSSYVIKWYVSPDGNTITLQDYEKTSNVSSSQVRIAKYGSNRVITATRTSNSIILHTWDVSGSTPYLWQSYTYPFAGVNDLDLFVVRENNGGDNARIILAVAGMKSSIQPYSEIASFEVTTDGPITLEDTETLDGADYVGGTPTDDNSFVVTSYDSQSATISRVRYYRFVNGATIDLLDDISINAIGSNGVAVTSTGSNRCVISTVDGNNFYQTVCLLNESNGTITANPTQSISGSFKDIASCTVHSGLVLSSARRSGRLDVRTWSLDGANNITNTDDEFEVIVKQTKAATLSVGPASQRVVTVGGGTWSAFGSYAPNAMKISIWNISLSGGGASKTAELTVDPAQGELFSHATIHPNPCSEATTFSFTLTNESDVTLKVYNQLGAQVEEIYNGHMNAGDQSIQWDASKLPAGMYWYSLESGAEKKAGKLVIE
ncbi:MAG: T9SS type A sorting domain-containing protein [Flavobacteriales bacterium]|nr:T9SS type A sorting domain-containing protein [Flavobacteriales bacterium]